MSHRNIKHIHRHTHPQNPKSTHAQQTVSHGLSHMQIMEQQQRQQQQTASCDTARTAGAAIAMLLKLH